MTPRTRILTIVALVFTGWLILGFWVGAFESLGGYTWRKRLFLGTSLATAFLTALLLHWKRKVHGALTGGFFVLSHCVYVLGQAFGQTFYVGATGAGDFSRTLILALGNQL